LVLKFALAWAIPDVPNHVYNRMEARNVKRDRHNKKTKEKEIALDAKEMLKTHSVMNSINLGSTDLSKKKPLFGTMQESGFSGNDNLIDTEKPTKIKSESTFKPKK